MGHDNCGVTGRSAVRADPGRGALAGGGSGVGDSTVQVGDLGHGDTRAAGGSGARCRADGDAGFGHGSSPHVVRKKMARFSLGTHTKLRNQTVDLSERARNILLYKERDSVLTQNDTTSFHLYAALKKLLLVYHVSFSSARKKRPTGVLLRFKSAPMGRYSLATSWPRCIFFTQRTRERYLFATA